MAVIYMEDEWYMSEEQKQAAEVMAEGEFYRAEMKIEELQEKLHENPLFEKLDLMEAFKGFLSGCRKEEDGSLKEEVLKQVYYQKVMS